MNGKMRDYYRILEDPLGKGAYGEVRKCIFKSKGILDKQSFFKEYRACKVMSKSHMEKKDYVSFENEISLLWRLSEKKHPNIMRLYHYFEDWNRLMIIMELCAATSLEKDILQTGRYESLKAAYIIKQLLSALLVMHDPDKDGKSSIIHRDIKPENIAIDEPDSSMPEIKLLDFGEAAVLNSGLGEK